MITRSITRPIASPIARAITSAYGAVWNPRALFALGEQGVIYDPSDLSALYQDSAGTTPVTAAGQPVGLMLDKRLGLMRGPELSGASAVTGQPVDGTFIAYLLGGQLVAGRTYELRITLADYSGADNIGFSSSDFTLPIVSGNGSYKFIATAKLSRELRILTGTAATANFSGISVRELPGNHAFQPTAASRPMLRDTQRRIDYDAVDDSLSITFPASLGAACTVARSIPGVGAQILTAQTIGATFSDNVDNCGLIIVNRALNAAETANLTRYLNQRAGV